MTYSKSIIKSINLLIIFSLLVVSYSILYSENLGVSADEKLEYEMVVEAQIIPFYAVDADDNPVYDLKKDDIKLYVNRKLTKMIDFRRYQFELLKTEKKEISTDEDTQVLSRKPVRYIFIILDCIFNSQQGLRRSIQICRNIIRNSSENDFFIFLDNNLTSGIKYICGPENNRQVLYNSLEKISKISGVKVKTSMSVLNPAFLQSLKQRRMSNFSSAEYADKEAERHQYYIEMKIFRKTRIYQFKQFFKALSELKYAFKTITQPKIMYLISEGIPNNIFGDNVFESGRKLFYFEYLEKAAKEINRGGTLLYVINPAKEQLMDYDPQSGKESLKLLAKKGGGRYLGGSDVDQISQKLTKSSAAYYEIAFVSSKISKKSLKVKIKPRDKNIKIFSIKQTGIRKPYHKMLEIEKNLFALNVILEASWSRMVAQVDRINYINKQELNRGKKIFVKVETLLPEDFSEKQLDVFAINLDPKSLKADFEFQNIPGKEKIEISVEKIKKKDQYFVIVDPETANCLYNKIN